jgi:hypothetical protein
VIASPGMPRGLLFPLPSSSGTWSLGRDAGLAWLQAGPVAPRVQTSLAMPGFACVIARKP